MEISQEVNMVATEEKIDSFKGDHAFLSNFWSCVIDYDGYLYPSVEHAYQASKTMNMEARERIRLAKTPGKAKELGQKVVLRSNWENDRLLIMRRFLIQKFEDPKLKDLLMMTGSSMLIEGNTWNDRYWGMCDGAGENWLGVILMTIRDSMRDVEQLSSPDATNGYMTTYSGQKIYIMNPEPSKINIRDIAHSLSNYCRWGGHISTFFSVAQHSVMVSYMCAPEDALNGLLHDSPESILGDMIRPFKYLPEMKIYKVIEKKVADCIAFAFNLPTIDKTPSVEKSDTLMLAREFVNLRLPNTVPQWAYDLLIANGYTKNDYFECWDPAVAKFKFLDRFEELTNEKV